MVVLAGAKCVLIWCCDSVTMVLIATVIFLREREREREDKKKEKTREEKRREQRGEEKREFEVDVCMVDGWRM